MWLELFQAPGQHCESWCHTPAWKSQYFLYDQGGIFDFDRLIDLDAKEQLCGCFCCLMPRAVCLKNHKKGVRGTYENGTTALLSPTSVSALLRHKGFCSVKWSTVFVSANHKCGFNFSCSSYHK